MPAFTGLAGTHPLALAPTAYLDEPLLGRE